MWSWIEQLARPWAMRRTLALHYFWGPDSLVRLSFRERRPRFPRSANTLECRGADRGSGRSRAGRRPSLKADDLKLRTARRRIAVFRPIIVRPDGESSGLRISFRVPTPRQSVVVQLYYRNWTLGQITLPVFTLPRFLDDLECRSPTVHVRLGGRYVACKSFVAAQARGVLASLVLSSQWNLTPILDLGLRLQVYDEDGELLGEEVAGLSTSQLAGTEAVFVAAPSIPRKRGVWRLDWLVGMDRICSQEIRAITLQQFLAQLKVSDMRFLIESGAGSRQLAIKLPTLGKKDRVGPCFAMLSKEAGTAGLARVLVSALVGEKVKSPLLAENEQLVTDGPTLVFSGTVDAGDLPEITGFEVRLGRKSLGTLMIRPAPEAHFDAEGSFQPVESFTWDGRAEDELNERLSALLGPADGET